MIKINSSHHDHLCKDKSKTDSCSITGTTDEISALVGGAKEGTEALLIDAKSNGDLVDNNNCSLDTVSGVAPSRIGIPVVDEDLLDSPCLSLFTKDPYILYSSAVRGLASAFNFVTLIEDDPEELDALVLGLLLEVGL